MSKYIITPFQCMASFTIYNWGVFAYEANIKFLDNDWIELKNSEKHTVKYIWNLLEGYLYDEWWAHFVNKTG